MKLSVIIPCFNEPATIEAVVHSALNAQLQSGWEKEVIVVDDGSDTATKDALRRLEAEVMIVRNVRNEGKGAAVQEGLRVASGDYILIQDADLEYDPNDYAALLQPLVGGQAQSVLGSRLLRRNNVPCNAVFFWGGIVVTKLFNLSFGTRFSDLATCYKVFPREYIPTLLSSPHKDFVFDAVDIPYLLASRGTVAEVPVSYHARTKAGGKKLGLGQGMRIVFFILLLRLGITSPSR